MEKTKLIPYGITDFSRIMRENYYYVDKTRFIPEIEWEAPFVFFLRPRRFGKSLLADILLDKIKIEHDSSEALSHLNLIVRRRRWILHRIALVVRGWELARIEEIVD